MYINQHSEKTVKFGFKKTDYGYNEVPYLIISLEISYGNGEAIKDPQ